MRVVMVTSMFPLLSESGIEQLVHGVAAAGHDVRVVTLSPGEDTGCRPLVPVPVTVVDVGAAGARAAGLVSAGRDALRSDRAMTARIARRAWLDHGSHRGALDALGRLLPLAARRADLVHFASAVTASQFWPALDLLDVPTVVSCRGSDVRIHPLANARLAERLPTILSRATRVHCVSAELAQRAEDHGLPAGRAVVIPPGIDIERFEQRRRPPAGPLRLVTVGRVHWVKGLDDMLRAVRLLLDRGCDVTLSIAGDGDDESMAALRLGIRDLHLDHHVRLLGRCRRAEVPEIVAGADVFVLSSLSEGISNAVLEAMAMGRPVVVTAAGGMAEAVRDGVDGYVVPTRQPHALADAIERLGDAAERRNEMGDAAAAHVRQSFTIKHHIERFCALYEEATR